MNNKDIYIDLLKRERRRYEESLYYHMARTGNIKSINIITKKLSKIEKELYDLMDFCVYYGTGKTDNCPSCKGRTNLCGLYGTE